MDPLIRRAIEAQHYAIVGDALRVWLALPALCACGRMRCFFTVRRDERDQWAAVCSECEGACEREAV